jgi:2-methylisocitrate lyase-like PEP mutase family enzyme
MVDGGATPHFTAAEAKETGFKIIIYPGFALAPVAQTVTAAAKELKETGDNANVNAANPGLGPKELFMICGLKNQWSLILLLAEAHIRTVFKL